MPDPRSPNDAQHPQQPGLLDRFASWWSRRDADPSPQTPPPTAGPTEQPHGQVTAEGQPARSEAIPEVGVGGSKGGGRRRRLPSSTGAARSRTTIAGHRIECWPPFDHPAPGKGEDRIFCGGLGDRWPAVIVADGVASVQDAAGNISFGDGGQAAAIALTTCQERLTAILEDRPDLPGLLRRLGSVHDEVAVALDEARAPGATTLLICLLYQAPGAAGDLPVWCYAVVGDGHLIVMNGRRRLDGQPVHSRLLSPGHKFRSTACISASGPSFPAVTGAVVYQPSDLLICASDGLDAVERFLLRDRSISLPRFLWDRLQEGSDPDRLWASLREFDYSDDAALGLILTG